MILEVRVTCREPLTVQGKNGSVVMVPFTGEASGPYFTGRVIGPGVDTQRYDKNGKGGLSARYILEGRDREGRACRVFIQNEGAPETGLRPRIVTDSPLLSPWEDAVLSATLWGAPGGVIINIYQEE